MVGYRYMLRAWLTDPDDPNSYHDTAHYFKLLPIHAHQKTQWWVAVRDPREATFFTEEEHNEVCSLRDRLREERPNEAWHSVFVKVVVRLEIIR